MVKQHENSDSFALGYRILAREVGITAQASGVDIQPDAIVIKRSSGRHIGRLATNVRDLQDYTQERGMNTDRRAYSRSTDCPAEALPILQEITDPSGKN